LLALEFVFFHFGILYTMTPQFFPTPADFRQWLEKHHKTEKELMVGFYKKASKIPSISWSESVDEAICFGWIDGVRRSIDDKSYMIRFTPRRPNSIWSAVNLKKIEELTKKGLMKPAGIAIFEKKKEGKSKVYAYEQKNKVKLDANYEATIKANPKAWAYFDALAPSYKKATIWWIMSAKREETRQKRLKVTIESAVAGLKIPHLRKRK